MLGRLNQHCLRALPTPLFPAADNPVALEQTSESYAVFSNLYTVAGAQATASAELHGGPPGLLACKAPVM